MAEVISSTKLNAACGLSSNKNNPASANSSSAADVRRNFNGRLISSLAQALPGHRRFSSRRGWQLPNGVLLHGIRHGRFRDSGQFHREAAAGSRSPIPVLQYGFLRMFFAYINNNHPAVMFPHTLFILQPSAFILHPYPKSYEFMKSLENRRALYGALTPARRGGGWGVWCRPYNKSDRNSVNQNIILFVLWKRRNYNYA